MSETMDRQRVCNIENHCANSSLVVCMKMSLNGKEKSLHAAQVSKTKEDKPYSGML